MNQESDQGRTAEQQPPGDKKPTPTGGRQQPSPTDKECTEPETEPCPPLPEPPDLCENICYGPPEWGDDPCEDLCKEPEEGQPWWKYSCKNLLKTKCKDPDPCSDRKGKEPCNPCEGLIDEPADDNGQTICFEPCNEIDLTGACDANGLKTKLEELKRCIATQASQKVAVEAVIQGAKDQKSELETLVAGFTDLLSKYEKARPGLLCREDCLRGFFQNTKAILEKELDPELRKALTDAINCEHCKLRKLQCCEQTLKDDLNCTTDLLKERDRARSEAKQAETAYKDDLKDFAGWIDKRFKTIEEIQKKITEAHQSQENQDDKKYRQMFYLFYWKFVPAFCDTFMPEICCSKDGGNAGDQSQANDNGKVCIGKCPGDWHPSQIDREALGELLCCAWALANNKKSESQQKEAEVARKESQLSFISDKYKQESNKEKFEKMIREKLETIDKDYECVS